MKHEEPPRPRALDARIPRDLETILLKAIDKDPARRYATAGAMAEDLQRFLADEPIVARPVGPVERAWRWCRRNPAPAALAAAVVAVALGATLSAFRFRALSRELELNLYFSDITAAHRELSDDNLGRAQELLDDCPPGLRQWEWSYLVRLCRVDPIVLHDPGSREVTSVAFSPDGERIAAAGGDGTVKVWNIKVGAAIQALRASTDFIYSVTFHPAGKHLAAAGADRKVRVWDLTTGQEVFAGPGYVGAHAGAAYGVAFSPDGRSLATGFEGVVNIWDWRNRRLLHTLPADEKMAASVAVAFSRDGRRLASGSWSGSVMIWDAETGECLRTLSEHRQPVSALAFSPDGRRLVSAGFDRLLIVWYATTGQLLNAFRAHDGIVLGVAFSPDGRRLASSGQDKMVRIWEAAEAETGREVLELRGHLDLCLCVAFSPDGRRLASCGRDATIRLWDAGPLQGNEAQEVLTLDQHAGEVWSMAVSPEGRRIASAGLASPGHLEGAREGLGRAVRPDGRRVHRPPEGRLLRGLAPRRSMDRLRRLE